MFSLSRLNNLLVVLIIVINGYLVAAPLYPRLHYWWQHQVSHQPQKLHHVIASRGSHQKTPTSIPAGEHIVIPKLGLDTPVFEGPTVATANKGVWRRPKSSTPDSGSNTVLVGHRFTYTNPTGIFYNLDKLTIGDEIALEWNGVQYTYTVSEVHIVPPTDVDVETPTQDARLTLYTCTPLWSAKNRLVIVAERNSGE